MSCFHIVSLDDDPIRAQGNLDAATEKLEIGKENSNHFSCSGIHECKSFIETRLSNGGEWIFILDCDLSGATDPDILDSRYGGFQVWSEVVAMFPPHRQPFAAIYSQRITKLIDAAWSGGEYSRKLLNPKLYKIQTGDFKSEDKNAPDLWSHCTEWVAQRQAELLLRIEPSEREEVVKAMRQYIAKPQAGLVEALGNSSLPIRVGMNLETWKVSTLFPKEWTRFSTKQDPSYLLEICFKLQSQLPAVWHDFARLLFDDHRVTPDQQFSSLGVILDATIEHVVDTMKGRIKDSEKLDRGFPLLNSHFQQLSLRQEKALAYVPSGIRSMLAADPVYQVIKDVAQAASGSELAQKLNVGELLRECEPFLKKDNTKALTINERENFKRLPVTPGVVKLIRGTLDNNARKHGGQETAVFLGDIDVDSIRWFSFRTQERGSGTPFEPDVVARVLEQNRHDPQPDRLSGLIEIVCGQYGGEIYILQEPKSDRKCAVEFVDSATTTIYMYISSGKIKFDICEEVPIAIETLKDQKIIPIGDYEGKPRPAGTFYLLGFPLREDGHP